MGKEKLPDMLEPPVENTYSFPELGLPHVSYAMEKYSGALPIYIKKRFMPFKFVGGGNFWKAGYAFSQIKKVFKAITMIPGSWAGGQGAFMSMR